MMRRNPWFVFLFVGFLIAASISLVMGLSIVAGRDSTSLPKKGSKSNLLVMDIKGIILDSDKFLKRLRKYADNNSIKGLLIRVNSPGSMASESAATTEVTAAMQVRKARTATFASRTSFIMGRQYAHSFNKRSANTCSHTLALNHT